MNFTDAVKKAVKEKRRVRHPKFNNYEWFNVEQFHTFLLDVKVATDDMWEVEELWYERFKEKYPNGVYCEVWDEGVYCGVWHTDIRVYGFYEDVYREKVVIVDYRNNFFVDMDETEWAYAVPLSRKYMPASLEEIKEGGVC